MLQRFKYLVILLLTTVGCQQFEDRHNERVKYTFNFGMDVQTRATPLTPDEQQIKSLFVTLYDDKGELIECLTAPSGGSVTFNVSQSRKPKTVYALANVTSNSNYAYFYDQTTELDFGVATDALKPYFATTNDYNRLTLSHRSTSGVLVAPTTTPLPMVGTASVSQSTTVVPMQLAVARLDILPQGKAISSVSITSLINSTPLNPATLSTQQSSTTAGSSIVAQFQTPVNDSITYYIPGNYGDKEIVVAVNQETPKSFSRMLANKYYSIAVGASKPIEILPEDSEMNFTVEGSVVGGGRTQQISLPKAYQTATLDIPVGIVENYKKNTTTDRVVFTLTIAANTGPKREGFLNVMFEKKPLKTYRLIQEGIAAPARPVITLLHNGRAVTEGSTIRVEAGKKNYPIEFQENPRDPLHIYKMRYKSGDTGGWWKTGYTRPTPSKDDELYHDCWGQNILIEENFGPAREVEVEIYNRDTPYDTAYLTFKIAQAASTNYLRLSAQSLQLDKWGNVYLYPDEFSVSSNQNWTLVNNAAGWVTVTHTPGTMNQPITLSVDENLTGAPRTGTLDFMVGGVRQAQYTINQSATQSSSRSMRFKLNLDLHTTNNQFKYVSPPPYNVTYYVKVIDIWNHNTILDDSNKFENRGTYGFITDAPASFNTVEAKNLEHSDFIITNYTGSAKTVSKDVQLNLMGDGATGIFREILYHIPYPAGVQPNQIVIVNISVSNIQGTRKHDPAIVTTTIETLPKRQ